MYVYLRSYGSTEPGTHASIASLSGGVKRQFPYLLGLKPAGAVAIARVAAAHVQGAPGLRAFGASLFFHDQEGVAVTQVKAGSARPAGQACAHNRRGFGARARSCDELP